MILRRGRSVRKALESRGGGDRRRSCDPTIARCTLCGREHGNRDANIQSQEIGPCQGAIRRGLEARFDTHGTSRRQSNACPPWKFFEFLSGQGLKFAFLWVRHGASAIRERPGRSNSNAL